MMYFTTHDGQNNYILEADGKWMFRFPKHEDAADELERECTLLHTIAPYIHSCRIPMPVLHQEDGPVYAVYPKISGEAMSRSLFDSFSNEEKLAFAGQIGAFLRELHGVPLRALPDGSMLLSVTDRSYWENFLERLEVHVFPHIRQDAREEIKNGFFEFLSEPANFQYEPVLIHGDLGAANLIWGCRKEPGVTDCEAAANSGQLAGVIDFGQASLGDPACDIASLICPRSLGEDFIPLLCEAYPEAVKLLPRARFYISTFALQDALFGAEHGDDEAFQDGISAYI